MAITGAAEDIKRRRRRRRQDKPPVSARLVLDDQIKSDVGILSEDLFRELFPRGKKVPKHCKLGEDCVLVVLTGVPRSGLGRPCCPHCPGSLDATSNTGRYTLVARPRQPLLFLRACALDHSLLPFVLLSPAVRRRTAAPRSVQACRAPQRHRCPRPRCRPSAPRYSLCKPRG